MDSVWDLIETLSRKLADDVFHAPGWKIKISYVLFFLTLYAGIALFILVFQGIKNPAKRTRLFALFGALVVNLILLYAINNRSAPFGVGDVMVALILNSMFLGFFWFGSKAFGTHDLKSVVDKKPKNTNLSENDRA